MPVLNGTLLDQNGVPVPGAQTYIYDAAGELADVTTSDGSPVEQPIISDEGGIWEAYVADGFYSAVHFYGGRERLKETNLLAGLVPADEIAVREGLLAFQERVLAESARDEAVDAAEAAKANGTARYFVSWTELAAATGMAAGDAAIVPATDAGTHTDPVVGGTVANAGTYRYSASPAGWQRIASLESTLAKGYRDEAATSAAALSGTVLAGITNATATYTAGNDPTALTSTSTPANSSVINYNTQLVAACNSLIVRMVAHAAGPVWIFTHSKSGDVLTAIDSIMLPCVAGYNEFVLDGSQLSMPAGCYPGFSGKGVVGIASGTSVTPYWGIAGSTPQSPSYTDATTATTLQYCIQFIAMTGQFRSHLVRNQVGGALPVPGTSRAYGSPSFTGATTPLTSNKFRIHPRVFKNGGILDTVDLNMGSSSLAPVIYSYSVVGGQFVPFAKKALAPMATGDNLAVPVNLLIPPNGYWGLLIDGVSSIAGQWSEGVFAGTTETFTVPALSLSGTQIAVRANVREFVAGNMAAFTNLVSLAALTSTAKSSTSTRALVVAESLLDNAFVFMGMHGQSPMVGPTTAISTRQEFGAKGFAINGSTVLNLVAPTVGTEEYPGFGAASYMRQRIMDQGGPSNAGAISPVIAGRSGVNATALDSLDKGSASFTAAIGQVTAAKAVAGSATFIHPGAMLYQGHADQADGTAKATYKATLLQFAIDYDADSRATVAGADLRRTYAVQVCSGLSYGSTQAAAFAITQAQREAANESNLICLIGPDYQVPYYDDRHNSSQGARIMGAYAARAMLSRRKWEPLQVVSSYVSGNTIVLVYNRGDLVLDTALMAPQVRSGFRVFNASAVEQTSFTVTASGNTVVLDMGASPTGFTWSYGNILATGLGTYTGGAGNLRDSAGDTDVFEGFALHNWAVLQEGAL